ncbi:kita-kyushu lung cancer antigen 1 [Trichosurus vulpecula]|uniref:kita-kyushu lung cancer antigen 1 n=1 Tax=Trichosurus vulpecula TaxID=9337 RepID=UPI00186B3210|nr:kita-kyushu lung cancer antigen 1 [Trichosurus vulpecula]
MLLGAAYLLLTGGIFVGFCTLVWIEARKRFKKKIPETTPDDDDATSKDRIENGLSVRSLSREILNDFPYSLAMQKKILLNLRIVEYKLAELEQFLVIQGLGKGYRRMPKKGPCCSIHGSQQ